jgi:hypothetical protein
LVQESLADEVAFVVLVDACPSHERVPHHRIDPRVLERGAGEPGRVPVQCLEGGIDEHHPEAEAAVHDRGGLRVMHGAYGLGDILGRLRYGRLCYDANALVLAGFTEVLEVGLANQ